MNRTDIITIPIPQPLLEEVTEWAKKMDQENQGKRTRDGGDFKNIKGCLGQWAVHQYMNAYKWEHTYSPPYVKNQHGDSYDIGFCGETWDVKCREWWDENYFFNIKMKMATHEHTESKPGDTYIFTTIDREYTNVYILGGLPYNTVWNNLTPISDYDQSQMKFPCAGYILSRDLIPIKKLILH